MSESPARLKITVTGIVQGVGFRPYVYNRARRYNLSGFVANTTAGVEIEAEGASAALDSFIHDLKNTPPPLSVIREISSAPLRLSGDKTFEIKSSIAAGEISAFVSPDMAICPECVRELFDPADRRYRYPFINCTDCGPRYTITRNIPYDRPNTAMAEFMMCGDCQTEYDDPTGRRFHAQPDCCSRCGPQLELRDSWAMLAFKEKALAGAISLLREGKILAIKGLGGFHLAVDATDSEAVARLRQKKGREEKPFAVMAPDLLAAQEICRMSGAEKKLLKTRQSPILLAKKKKGHGLAPEVAPHNDYFGVMLPYTPLHHLLMQGVAKPLVMTSGNFSEEPICTGNEEAFARLGGIADAFLVHNRKIFTRADDSVVVRLSGRNRLVRRSRGYAPSPIKVGFHGLPVLAVGAELKNSICLLKDDEALVSQHIGDITNLEAYNFFQETIAHLEQIFATRPAMIAHDLHPDYISTRWALEQHEVSRIAVQHHHAHLAACLAENMLAGPAIGLIMDGTGYGPDGTIWGGEVLVGDCYGYDRFACFEPLPLPGGDAAVKAPWRTAIGFLHAAHEGGVPELSFPAAREVAHLKEQIAGKINCPNTSSCGRLFDAVAAISGGRQTISYEAQAAIEFMQAAGGKLADPVFPYELIEQGDLTIISTRPLIRAVADSVIKGANISEISRRFHQTLINIFVDITQQARAATGLSTIALSGGVFQNRLLFENLVTALEGHDFKVLTHRQTPTNDGCISLGQAMVARAQNIR